MAMNEIFCGRRKPDEQQQTSEERVNFNQIKLQEENIRIEKEKSLFEAIQKYDIITIRKLIDNGMNVQEAREGQGKKTVLHCLADMSCEINKESKLKKMFELLLEKGCLLDATDNFGNTAVKLAAEKGNVPILKLLVEKKADVKKEDKLSGDTPLHWAAKKGMLEAVHILITNGHADVNIQNNSLKTPLHLAVEENKKHIVLLLLYHNANPNLKDNGNEPPLRFAETNHYSEIVKLLNEPHETFESIPLPEYAEKYDYPEIVKLFKKPPTSELPDGHGEYVAPDCARVIKNTTYNIVANEGSQLAIGPNSSLNIIQSGETQGAHQPLPESNSSPLPVDATPSAPQEPENDLSPSFPKPSAPTENV